MRIFSAVRHSFDAANHFAGLWSANFHPALRELGHEVVESAIDLAGPSGFAEIAGDFTPQEREVRARCTEQIIDELRRAHRERPVSLFLCHFYNAHFDPAAFDEVRRLGIPSVNFFCNSIFQFDLVAAIAAKADFSWHAEKNARPFYLAAGGRPVWVQMGADPHLYRPVPGVEPLPKLSFIGQRYADRDRWLAALLRAGLDVDIFGYDWLPRPVETGEAGGPSSSRFGRTFHKPGTLPQYLAAMAQVYRANGLAAGTSRLIRQFNYRRQTRALSPVVAAAAKGVIPVGRFTDTVARYAVHLNFSNVWADGRPGSALIPHVRLRDFEIPMCRGCYLTAMTDEIAEFYDVGREIETYSSTDELIDKARFLLAHPEQAERLRAAGHARARADHTWVRRFELLFDKIGLRQA